MLHCKQNFKVLFEQNDSFITIHADLFNFLVKVFIYKISAAQLYFGKNLGENPIS